MTSFFNDLFRSLNIPLVLNAQQSLDAIKAVYPAYNGTVNRDELFTAFKVLLGLYISLTQLAHATANSDAHLQQLYRDGT